MRHLGVYQPDFLFFFGFFFTFFTCVVNIFFPEEQNKGMYQYHGQRYTMAKQKLTVYLILPYQYYQTDLLVEPSVIKGRSPVHGYGVAGIPGSPARSPAAFCHFLMDGSPVRRCENSRQVDNSEVKSQATSKADLRFDLSFWLKFFRELQAWS